MPRHLAILCHGRDPILLRTRQQIFEHAGFSVETADSSDAFDEVLASCEVEVVVLCHSLSEAECEYAKQKTHAQAVPPKVVVLNKGTHKCDAHEPVESFDSRSGPAALVSLVRRFILTEDAKIADNQGRGPLVRLLEQYDRATSGKQRAVSTPS